MHDNYEDVTEFLTFHEEFVQGSAEWLAFRKGRITASNAYKLLTKGKNAAILANKGESFDNIYTDRGHALEAEVREKLNKNLDPSGFFIDEVGCITNELYPDCAYSPDGVMRAKGRSIYEKSEWQSLPLIEIKSYNDVTIDKEGKKHIVNKHLKCAKDFTNVPLSAVVQMQFGMMIAEKHLCYLVLYNPDCVDPDLRVKIWPVKRDDRLIKRLQEKLK